MFDASAGGFFFYDAGNQNFAFKPRFFSSVSGSHNHCSKRTFRVYCASSVDFAFFYAKRQVPSHCVHVSTEENNGFAFADNANDVADVVYANFKTHLLHFKS